MSKWVVVALGIVALVAAVIWWRGRGAAPGAAVATRGTIDVTIQTIGTLQAAGVQTARAQTGGAVVQLGVAAGDVVAAGDIVALLDRAPYERALADAERRVSDAEFTLQLAERRAADNPNDNQARTDAVAAGESVAAAQRALQDARDNLNRTAILAPIGGSVLELQIRVGDVVNGQQSIATIAPPASFEIRADVDELDLPNVRPGATARFRLDAYPANELTGVVVATAPQARQQGGATVFTTTINFTAPPDLDLRPGMNAAVTIVTAAREGVLLIPERALKSVGERTFVTVVIGGKRQEREVTLGYRGGGQVEIVRGVAEGEAVLLR